MKKRNLLSRIKILVLAALLIALFPSASVDAALFRVYDSFPAQMPGNFPSYGFAATSTSELGDHIRLSDASGKLETVQVNFSSWACENDYSWQNGAWVAGTHSYPNVPCMSSEGSGYTHSITLNLYQVDHSQADPAVGALIASKTASFLIPFRPTHDETHCPGSDRWYSASQDTCYSGYAFTLSFDFSTDHLSLPEELIYGVAFNTQSHGANPLNAPGPYNSLNLSVQVDAPSVGTNVEDLAYFWNTTWASYGDGTFKRFVDTEPYTPVVRFITYADQEGPLASDVKTDPNPIYVNRTDALTVNATISDGSMGATNIASAQARVSGSSTWRELDPVDGNFDSPTEAVTGSYLLAELGLKLGSHASICVRGIDALDNTGPETCSEPFVVQTQIFLPITIHN